MISTRPSIGTKGSATYTHKVCATGTSTINNVGQIERGYEHIAMRLRALGARLEAVSPLKR